ncbi:MAG: hypothetical protein QW728_04105, partial [Thermoplasmata archaeon]
MKESLRTALFWGGAAVAGVFLLTILYFAGIIPVAILMGIVLIVLAIKERILFKMAFRNLVRHRGHSILVIVGLLVGTSIISGSMVTGDSVEYFIVREVYNRLDLTDITVAANDTVRYTYGEWAYFFNNSIYEWLKENLTSEPNVDGIAPLIIKSGEVEDIDSGQYEPDIRLIGFEPEADREFGPFYTSDGDIFGEQIGETEVILNAQAAKALAAKKGDKLSFTLTKFRLPNPLTDTFIANISQSGLSQALVGYWSGNFTGTIDGTFMGQMLNVNYNGTYTNFTPSDGPWNTTGAGSGIANFSGNWTGHFEGYWNGTWFGFMAGSWNGTFKGTFYPQPEPPAVLNLTVAYVCSGGGKADYNGRPNAFIRLSSLQQYTNTTGLITQVRVSVKGGVRDSLSASPVVNNT